MYSLLLLCYLVVVVPMMYVIGALQVMYRHHHQTVHLVTSVIRVAHVKHVVMIQVIHTAAGTKSCG